MGSPPVASLIVITRNSAARLGEPLSSFATQQAPLTHEVLVVDNGSRDSTAELIQAAAKKWPHVRLVYESEPGTGRARHAGACASRGEILVFVDGDMVADPGLVARHLEAHAEKAEVCVIGGIVSHPGHHPFERMLAYIYDGPRASLGTRAPTYQDCWSGNISLSRDLYFRLGGFHDVYGGYGADANLAQRMAEETVPLRYAPAALTHHRMHDRFRSRLRRAYLKGIAVGIHRARKQDVARSATEMAGAGSWPRVTEWVCLMIACILEPLDRGSGIPMKPLRFLYDLGIRVAMSRGKRDFERGRVLMPPIFGPECC
jgi:glycosyltransferase involved in cell wall biosynthesis